MRDLFLQLVGHLQQRRSVVYCRLVETRGSTPQKPGALMLVYSDGSQSGTLGGGCVEAEVKRRALAILDGGQSEIATFQLDSDYGWDDGLICGGRMQILVEPLSPGSDPRYFEQLGEQVAAGKGALEAIVFDEKASGLKTTASYLFDEDRELVGQRNTDARDVPAVIRDNLKPLIDRPRAYAVSGIAFLPLLARCRLIIVGGGHVGKAVADLAADLDFDVWVVDDREEFVSENRFPRAQQRIAGEINHILPGLSITPDTYCLIVTRGHQHDEKALYYLAERGARYVGLIGSRRKIRMIYDDLVAEGVSPTALSQVYAPLGIDIGSQTVPEIAVSICAELVSHRNRQGVVPGRPASVPVPE